MSGNAAAPAGAVEIVPFVPAFAAGVINLILPIQGDEFGIPIALEGQPDLLDIHGYYQKGAGNFWVAVAAGEVVGSIALLDIGNGQGALRKMFVNAAHRGRQRAVAQRLLDTLLAWSRSKQIGTIYLGTTEKFLAAHRFYEKNGFRRVERDALPPAFPVMVVDTRFYACAP